MKEQRVSCRLIFARYGMYHDPYTGKYHTHYREYDPIHARWLSEDPAGYQDGLNLYAAYMGVNGTDPLGLTWLVRALAYTYGCRGSELGEAEELADEALAGVLLPYAYVSLVAETEGIGAAHELVVDSLAMQYANRIVLYSQHTSGFDEACDIVLDWRTLGCDFVGLTDMSYGIEGLQGKTSYDYYTGQQLDGQQCYVALSGIHV